MPAVTGVGAPVLLRLSMCALATVTVAGLVPDSPEVSVMRTVLISAVPLTVGALDNWPTRLMTPVAGIAVVGLSVPRLHT